MINPKTNFTIPGESFRANLEPKYPPIIKVEAIIKPNFQLTLSVFQ